MHEQQQNTAVLTVKEVAEALRLSPRTVNRLISERRLASVLLGRSRRVRPEAVAEFLTANETIAR